MRTDRVHWTLGVKSPVQRKMSEMTAPGQRRGERHQQDAPVVAQSRLARRVGVMQGDGSIVGRERRTCATVGAVPDPSPESR